LDASLDGYSRHTVLADFEDALKQILARNDRAFLAAHLLDSGISRDRSCVEPTAESTI
jgi:hypothetical protein